MVTTTYIEKFASYTTMHGFPRIVASKATPKRLAWIIVFTTAWTFFTIHTSMVLNSYLKYPKKTTTEVVTGGVPFPDITLCNLGSFDFYTVHRLSKDLREVLAKEQEKTTEADLEDEEDTWWHILDSSFPEENNEIENTAAPEENNETENSSASYLNDTFIKALYKYYYVIERTGIKNNSYVKTLHDKLFSRTTLSATIPIKLLTENGVREKQFIVKCTFRNEPCKFKKIFDPHFFNCFTFTAPKVALADGEEHPPLLEGTDNGFSVILLAGTRMLKQVDNPVFSRLPGIYAGDSPLSGAGGIRVVIHPPGTKPFPMTEGYDVPPERMASLGINLSRQKRLGQPYGHCSKVYPFLKRPEHQILAGPYRRATCQKVCIQHDGIYNKCGCIENTLPTKWELVNDDLRVLSYNKTMKMQHLNYKALHDECLFGTPEESNSSLLRNILSSDCILGQKCSGTDGFIKCFKFNSNEVPKCDDEVLKNLVDKFGCAEKEKNSLMANATFLSNCGCHPACDHTSYKVSYSLSQWPSHGVDGETAASEIMDELQFTKRFRPASKRKFYDQYWNNDSRKAMKDFSKINVYIADADVFLTKEEPAMTVTDLISDIGGQLGVWIGVSVLTLAEVLEILIAMTIDCCRKRSAKSRKTEVADLKDVALEDV